MTRVIKLIVKCMLNSFACLKIQKKIKKTNWLKKTLYWDIIKYVFIPTFSSTLLHLDVGKSVK